MFPVMLLLLDFMEARPFRFWNSMKRLFPYFLLSALLAAVYNMPSIDPLAKSQESIPFKLLIVLHNVLWYPLTTVFPYDLSPAHPLVRMDAQTCLTMGAALLAGFAAVTWLAFHARGFLLRRAIPFAAMAYLALAPMVGFVRFSGVDYADRYSYFFAPFVWFALAWCVSRLLAMVGDRRLPALAASLANCRLLSAAFCFWAFSFAASAFLYQDTFSSSRTLLLAAINHEPPNLSAICLLANLERRTGEAGASNRMLERLEKAGVEMQPFDAKELPYGQVLFWRIRAEELLRDGHDREALAILQAICPKVMTIKYFSVDDVVKMLSSILLCQLNNGLNAEAIATVDLLISTCVKSHRSQELPFYKGLRCLLCGDYASAELLFSEALSLNPSSKEIQSNLERARELKKKF